MSTMKTLAEMTAEIREINVAKGWRPAEGGPGENTWGDYIALLHSEVSETLEAYRDHRMADATNPICGRAANGEEPCPEHGPSKPEGVGSELADVLIRFLDMCDVFGLEVGDADRTIDEIVPAPMDLHAHLVSFGDWVSWLHRGIVTFNIGVTEKWVTTGGGFLSGLISMCSQFGIDLGAEYERKVAYNRGREFQHGGRTLAGEKNEVWIVQAETKETKDA